MCSVGMEEGLPRKVEIYRTKDYFYDSGLLEIPQIRITDPSFKAISVAEDHFLMNDRVLTTAVS